jgi:hypothetical protein
MNRKIRAKPPLPATAEAILALRQQLVDHQATRPVMPRPFLPNSEEGIVYHRALTLFTDTKNLLIHQINVAEHPIDFGARQERPIPALRPYATRLRQ